MKEVVRLPYEGATSIWNDAGEDIIECHTPELAERLVNLINQVAKHAEMYDAASTMEYTPEIVPFGLLADWALLEVEL